MSIAHMGLWADWRQVWSDNAPPVLAIALLLLGLFLILLVLIQRGKGGGLAGAFGGAGGSSAFGSRAGDTFTRITIYVAAGWILLIMILIKTTQPAPITATNAEVKNPAGAPTTPPDTLPTEPESAPPRADRRPAASGFSARPAARTATAGGSEVDVLCSMTGYGDASYQSDDLQVAVELRAVNNRYLKVVLRASEPYNLLEAEFEKVVRRTVRRGAIQIHLRCQRKTSPQDFQINAVALRSYLTQLNRVCDELSLPDRGQALLSQVLALPGVVPDPAVGGFRMDEEWPVIERVLEEALGRLQAMRLEEGRAMAQELLLYRDQIGRDVEQIRKRTPQVMVLYRDRLLERVRGLLSELDVKIDRSDLIKEVSVFAERGDVAEEVVRLGSHLDQFQEVFNEPESAGRKLEFLVQEMGRETNTIGSKASDVEISRHVVEIKSTLEKIREQVQNIE